MHRKKLMEAVMRGLARVLGEDEDLWGLVGLLHDIDYEYVGRDPLKHGLGVLELLKGVLPEYALEAIAMHNERNGVREFLGGRGEDVARSELQTISQALSWPRLW